jgi:hypothetical protein
MSAVGMIALNWGGSGNASNNVPPHPKKFSLWHPRCISPRGEALVDARQ